MMFHHTWCDCGEDEDEEVYDRTLTMTKEDIHSLSTESLKSMLEIARTQSKSAWIDIIQEELLRRDQK